MTDQTIQLLLSLDASPEIDDEELEELTRKLRKELLELDIEAADLVSAGEAPSGARAVEPVTLGTLLLTLAASGGVLTTVVNVLQDWLSHHDKHSVTLEIGGDKIQVTGISSEEQKQLIDAWLTRSQGSVITID